MTDFDPAPAEQLATTILRRARLIALWWTGAGAACGYGLALAFRRSSPDLPIVLAVVGAIAGGFVGAARAESLRVTGETLRTMLAIERNTRRP